MSGKRGQVTSSQTSSMHPGLMQRSDIVYVEIPPLSGWWQKECSVTTTITRLVRWLSMCRLQSGYGLTHGAPDSPRYLTVANVHTLVYM